ncbi:MAG: glycosyltransferase, partial [Patescibacteria group bacterium]|nr:glycosyltransferase [Patescibacteria group bacterium]
RRIKQKNIRLITFDGLPINKPHSLNIGLSHATKNVVVVFDAEDQPHKDIYSIANTIFNKKDISILQSGVQLINYSSRWFSVFNVLEYYFWFKSGLHFFTKIGKITPLAGNTIFFDKQILTKIGGWDENCLTEDAEIAFRLIPNGGKIGIVYDERHVTFEETPIRLKDFIKQRTRWNQGFFQVFSRMDWIRLPKLRQKILSVYILLSPLTQLIVLLYLPFTIWALFFYKIPVLISLYSFLPMYLFLLQIALYIIGFIEFNFAYKLHAPFFTYLIIVIMFFPYQLILTISAIRACYRVISNQYQWEKTKHANIHRSISFDSSTSYA